MKTKVLCSMCTHSSALICSSVYLSPLSFCGTLATNGELSKVSTHPTTVYSCQTFLYLSCISQRQNWQAKAILQHMTFHSLWVSLCWACHSASSHLGVEAGALTAEYGCYHGTHGEWGVWCVCVCLAFGTGHRSLSGQRRSHQNILFISITPFLTVLPLSVILPFFPSVFPSVFLHIWMLSPE